MTTQAYMTLTTVAAWVFLALVAIGLAYGIYEGVMTYIREREKDREEAAQDMWAFETLEEAVEGGKLFARTVGGALREMG